MRTLLVVMFLLLGSTAWSGGPVTSELSVKRMSFEAGGRVVQVWLTLFSGDQHEVRVIDNAAPGRPYRYIDLALAMRSEGCVAGCNGSFFERYPFDPSGYMICDGVPTGTLDQRSWMKGLIVVRGGVLSLEPIEDYKVGDENVTQLLQSGPWLVRMGRPVADKNPLKALRTFIGTDGNGGWFIGMCDDVSLHDLGLFLTGDAMRAVVGVREALNLDGGPSTAFWVRGARFHHPEKWTVRNFIGLVPKQSDTPAR